MVASVAKISPKGQITLPAEIRRALNLREGDRVVFQVSNDGKVFISGLPSYEPETVIGILRTEQNLDDFQEIRRKARLLRSQRYLQVDRADDEDDQN
ncbi:AbrB/MazE/SpoVT family DNA-binding domain-containing protein [Alicyclobacillus acidocaldarius]|uniref:Transcriptional regulator, AbrB family n=1 Tax=Alicyclobacillus acidocaldarius subsp. acidocaldarius (strain ATCC 27009 / DSM 446 / BCRC 14685 / JCM 5260 / KCTC 1825 / NBRC 15652 / NCIMB 11725 / NRRL B-14509 / 104-IA) TaxID=521098 RepID=C8WVW5_ALIAD|nr:type II toxin-antitoxin system PrlF family antitoxin [Alicyclobacillus acidocaldarius]ACV58237.1 transcriptional regulator, AbrB family [Alicyclobacillus acidocaldarius subsp. acidocaldarius DSM 446]